MMAIIILVGIFILLVGSQVYFGWQTQPKKDIDYRIVKAGDVYQSSQLYIRLQSLNNRVFTHNGERIDISDYKVFVVDGESMSYNNIHTGDVVFVKELIGESRLKISKDKIILFELDASCACSENNKTGDTEYKLRKFIDYIDINLENAEVDKWVAKQQINNIPRFKEKLQQCAEKHHESKDSNNIFLCSTTWHNGNLDYSFHPIRSLMGSVEFTLPKDRL